MSGATTVTNLQPFFDGAKAGRKVTPNLISASLWALAGYDRALQHLVELRELMSGLPSTHPSPMALERLTSQYLHAQCEELAGTDGPVDLQSQIDATIGADPFTEAIYHSLGVTDDPLMIEIITYAAYLVVHSSYGLAPWRRLAPVIAEAFYAKHPLAKVHL